MTDDRAPGAAPTPSDPRQPIGVPWLPLNQAHAVQPPVGGAADTTPRQRPRWLMAGVGATALAVASLVGVSAAQAQTDDSGSSSTTTDDTGATGGATDGSESPDASGDSAGCPEGLGGPPGERPDGESGRTAKDETSESPDAPATSDTTQDTTG